MKRFAIFLMALAWMACAQAAEPITVMVWPEGEPNHFENGYDAEYMQKSNLVEEATLLVYPAADPNGLAVIACPGGSYCFLAKFHEGMDMADWYNERGITYAVLLYRMPQGHDDVPLSDVHQSIRILRDNADKWGIKKVGIMGSSAGGHLASTAATHFTPETRPDFQILFYPVISMDPKISHAWSRHCLIGDNPSKQLETLYSNELQVSADTPPAFIMHSSDDDVVPVENSLRYYKALTDNGVMSSLNIYPTGNHGWGFGDGFAYKPAWTKALEIWLETQK